MKISQDDFRRLNEACKMIEADAAEAYRTVSARFGTELATGLLILFYRLQLNPKFEWPAPENVEEQVQEYLKQYHIMSED